MRSCTHPAYADRDASAHFIGALQSDDLAGVRAVPKGELHIHSPFGGCRAYIRARTGQDIRPVQGVLHSMDEMHAWYLEHLAPVFDIPGREALPFEATFARCRRDGVVRVDMGFEVSTMARKGVTPKAIWKWLSDIHGREAPEIEWRPQLLALRNNRPEDVERWTAPLLELGVFRTFDLCGEELSRPIEVFAPLYRRVKAAGLTLKCHVGEWGSADEVWRAVELLELEEVRHGIAAADSPEAMRFLAGAGVRLNLCPTSNLKLARVASINRHPIRRLYDAGVRVTVNTDDPLMFGSDLSEEFLLLFRSGLMSADELDQIRRESLR